MAPRSFTQVARLLALAATQLSFAHSLVNNNTHSLAQNNTHHNETHAQNSVSKTSASRLGLHGLDAAAADKPGQDDHTCGPDRPCKNKACCGKSGWCGYSPDFCGTGCQSNCDAKAECGQYASPQGKTCPLNVCCSEFGFCGTTTEFCAPGCQSYCNQPKPPGGSGNDVRTRVIGYWESWNSQHPCGRMGLDEIPVELLTHLNVAFGYISEDFRITNMDGISDDLYRNMGNVKARNPALKISIALGGWTFNDPGPWQNRFSQVVATENSRATFIKNLLGFLSEYGYDGVDFDWEYPGADDRGGTDADPVKYVVLLQELRAAISASGHDYIVTFTAPSSYWYLRHFRVKEMEAYVDWINLMSYDIHGVWDGNNPIGNHILAHTNLTEIDLALDLFWRVGVAPSSIVLGLGFYGRSFTLSDTSCWKPGCLFSGPGAAGECTATAGILSYREIQQVLQKSGATAYLDTDAAAKYVVYDKNSWISFDDAETFELKIQYANKIGLAGLMIWAIDLDDGDLSALEAVTSVKSGVNRKFDLTALGNLFPKELLPPPDADVNYGLMTFGREGQDGYSNPRGHAFGFILVAGEKHVVSSLQNRDGFPEPITFLDCPTDIGSAPDNSTHTARVVCLNEDVKGCFQLLEGGIEGTVLQMPDECGRGSLGRAIAMEASKDQSIPAYILASKQATSEVFDLLFDFDVMLMRRDSEKTSIRIDVTNAADYWDSIDDSPGIQSRDLHERFFAPESLQWKQRFDSANVSYKSDAAIKVKKDIDISYLWHSAKECTVASGNGFIEGLAAYVSGALDISLTYGFSAIINGYGLDTVQQAAGFIGPVGTADLSYGISGVADIDIAQSGMGNPATKVAKKNYLDTHKASARAWPFLSYINFNPYYRLAYTMATYNSTDREYPSPTTFDGSVRSRMVTNYGDVTTYFPPLNDTVEVSPKNLSEISVSDKNILYSSPEHGGVVVLQTILEFGMSAGHTASASYRYYPGDLAHYNKSCIDYSWSDNFWQTTDDSEKLGWSSSSVFELYHHEKTPEDAEVCYAEPDGGKEGYMPGWGYGSGSNIDPTTFVGADNQGSVPLPDVFLDSQINCDKYPAFPATCTYPWDHIENNKWDSIARYWGNSSMSCDNWSTTALQDADERDIGGKMCRAKYNRAPWQINNSSGERVPASFTQLLHSELGNESHLDRLTVFLARPNRMKGAMFSGSRAVAKDKYIGMDVQEQLLAIKDMGMVFTYMNDPKVWDAFCKTYEAMYKHMENYNDWWVNTQESTHGKIPKLQDMFKEYMRVTLRSFSNRAQDEFAWAYSQRAADAGKKPFSAYWATNNSINKKLLKLLPPDQASR
ncbi:bacteriodes thetaiotaomicron symbiotic chitinase, putative [Cordyceps militaris CM01]|uniref:chitinase n=1 Tax=Cordyceps militaris (strain CM01) TaxID=983644 RepID=G3JFP9_CORMM|nr:bacteriodes thetaiotaomicron symbiotic chitinase, putative [Cordyceps militaris CM01]EGX92282.1 bacteriodes thetaiotaomicron symbiotic chitinase, putative [Cordyceps militaris CM01]